MRVVVIVAIALMVACGGASADYVDLFDYFEVGGGYWFYSYEYHRNPATTLVDGVSTWTLSGLYGLDAEFADVTGPIFWDSGVINPDFRSITWTYDDPLGEGGMNTIFATFDVLLYNPTGNHTLVPWDSDPPGSGSPEFSGTVIGGVPEPGTLALFALGFGALAARARRKRDG